MESDVSTVDKIHKSRVRGKVTEYQVTWKGHSRRHKTREPASHLLDYGARELVEEFEMDQAIQPAVRMTTVSPDMLTAQHLKTRHNLTYSLEQCTQAVKDEIKNTVGEGRQWTKLKGAE